MKAAVYDKCGVPEVLTYKDVPDPCLGASDVLIDVEAISIEGGDLINRRLTPPLEPGYIVGYASAGTVIAVGDKVTERKPGDRVTGFASDGSHAALRAVPENQTWIVPDGVGFAEAAALPISFGTAHHCLFARGALQTGETVLVQAAAGGVGLAAIQLAKHAGAKVIAVSSGSGRLPKLQSIDVDHVIDHRNDDVAETVLELTDGAGANLIVDPVGATLTVSLKALAQDGRLVFVGNAGGGDLTLDLWPALQANQSLFGVFMGTKLIERQVRATVDSLLSQIAEAKLKVFLDKRFPLASAAKAHDYAERCRPFGRVIMQP
ncbi:quinone oxidoreductase family protein [Paracoccus onubensis]|uniref:Zinc-binding alcohol dehydrogenase family protein n=1 Tax=Paracoccus onubensis TaxID=1675788 RepID=A0A418SM31_9RHOB|nr:zinc-binding alcohol dehydrogenase family protein [Paracoccus onubensis]RJE82020.1 zinc-binding alcohol dehydrogenase family protein [Paracoccus onubensis]